jgi:hypothetical protein
MITHQMAMETEDMGNSPLSETRCECIFFFHCHECAGAMRVTREERQCFLSPYVSEPVTSTTGARGDMHWNTLQHLQLNFMSV